VARAVDAAGGQGWVTEYAGPSATLADALRSQLGSSAFAAPDDQRGADQLLGLLQQYPYLTRLYSRLSAEQMTSDPVFGRSSLGEVPRAHRLSRVVADLDQCTSDVDRTDPCDFSNCGAAGLCRPVAPPPGYFPPAGCACLPGATARTTLTAYGGPAVVCQDGRLSFINPGDRETPDVAALPDPCADFQCGRGQCVAMNLTPTCVCDQGFVAVGSVEADGSRRTTCVAPEQPVPLSFYDERLPELPESLPGGRELGVPRPLPASEVTSDPAGFPMPRSASASGMEGGCQLGFAGASPSRQWWALGLVAAATWRRRRQVGGTTTKL
jgi:hypothetical protein